jgi:hypothetical protein
MTRYYLFLTVVCLLMLSACTAQTYRSRQEEDLTGKYPPPYQELLSADDLFAIYEATEERELPAKAVWQNNRSAAPLSPVRLSPVGR